MQHVCVGLLHSESNLCKDGPQICRLPLGVFQEKHPPTQSLPDQETLEPSDTSGGEAELSTVSQISVTCRFHAAENHQQKQEADLAGQNKEQSDLSPLPLKMPLRDSAFL
ncbi:mCG66893 [Mus musculus]|nr:mCG66893 [Mus musculus]